MFRMAKHVRGTEDQIKIEWYDISVIGFFYNSHLPLIPAIATLQKHPSFVGSAAESQGISHKLYLRMYICQC